MSRISYPSRKYTTDNKAREMARRVRQRFRTEFHNYPDNPNTDDIPEVSAEFFKTAKLREPQS